MSSQQLEALDASVYDLPIPLVDGLKADRLKVMIGGGEELDRTDEQHLEWFSSLQLGQEVELRVIATVVGKPSGFSPAEDGPGTVTCQATLRVHTIRR